MPFGFNKGEKDDLDSKKSSLFSGRSKASKSSTPTPSAQNPYAVPPAGNDPYAARSSNPYATQGNDPYASKSESRPPAYNAASYGNAPAPRRDEKSPVPPGGYGGGPQRTYQNSGASYAQNPGYGSSNPYGNDQPQQSRYGPGGYGGLGRSNSQETMSTDAGRNALFGDAAQRAATKAPEPPPEASGDSSYANSGGYGSSDLPGGYGESRQLTAEEEEDQDVEAIKQQSRYLNREAANAAERAAARLRESNQRGAEMLARLGVQGEMLSNADRQLDLAAIQNRQGQGNVAELRRANRSMFSPQFDSRKKREAKLAYEMEVHRQEREQREETAANAYKSQSMHGQLSRGVNNSGYGGPMDDQAKRKARAEAMAKYTFEGDEEDEETEDRIDNALNDMQSGLRTMKLTANALGETIDDQNKLLERMGKKAANVDDGIAANNARLKSIR